MQDTQLDYGKIIEKAFRIYKQHFTVLFVSHLLAILVSTFTAGLLAGPMLAGLVIIILSILDQKTPPQPGDVFQGFNFFLPAFLLYLCILGAGFLLGLLFNGLASIAGLLIGTITMFSIFLVVDKKQDFWPAIMGSYEIVKSRFFIFLGLYLIGSLISAAGLIACCVGIFLTAPMMTCMIAIVYRGLESDTDVQTVKPEPPPAAENTVSVESPPVS